MVVVDKRKYLVTARVPIGRFFDVPDDDAYVELREADIQSTLELEKAKSLDESSQIEECVGWFRRHLPDLIIGHNLYRTEDQPMTSSEVTELIFDKSQMMLDVWMAYREKVGFIPGRKSKGP